MSNGPTTTVDQLILDHLDGADLAEPTKDLLFAALLGEDELRAVLDGAAPEPSGESSEPPATGADRTDPEADADPDPDPDADPAGAYLSRIEVQGFRGIGEAATLDVVPGPGLTIVTGRNGSGKSSFAEAAELALTGDNRRWSDRTSVWRDGWRNLHATGERYVRVGLGLDGHPGGATVECRWEDGAGLDEGASFLQLAGQRRQSVAELGWDRPLELYRPFLSYSELGGLLSGRPSEMYDALHSVLGLGRLSEVEERLKTARRETDQARKAAGDRLPALREAVAAHPDPRARQAEELLAASTADLERLEQLATGADDGDGSGTEEALHELAGLTLPARDQVAAQVTRLRAARERVAALAGTPAAEARLLAGLLREALRYHRHHPDQPCPVCGGRPLDAGWQAHAQAQVDRLTGQAEELEQAEHAATGALRALRELVPAVPAVLHTADAAGTGADLATVRTAWQHWDELLRVDDPGPDPDRVAAEALARFDPLAGALDPVRAAAGQALQHRRQAWQPLADQVRDWVATARRGRTAARVHTAARAAVEWLRTAGGQIRDQRLAPLAAEATRIWTLLRQDSSVDLGAVRLAGAGNRRRVDLDVAVDGEPGAALGVMSQGELHALALSLFLPRATTAASPFRFVLIDDPVQSMDPAKVHGLAQVLDRVAADRQVVVFTHDDRLPTAVRQLGIRAHLRVVTRRESSQVSAYVDQHGDPALRYLDDAHAVAKDNDVDPALRTKVTCVLVRDAIEAKCHDLVRTRGMRAGRQLADVEADLGQDTRLRQTVTRALLGDPDRENELNGTLGRLHPRAPDVVGAANRGAHGGQVTLPLPALVDDARRLVDRMGAR